MPKLDSYSQFTGGWPRFRPYDVDFRVHRRGSNASAKKAAKIPTKSTVDEVFGSQEWRVLKEQVHLEKTESAAHRLARLRLDDFDDLEDIEDIEMTDVSDCSSLRDWSSVSESEDVMELSSEWYYCHSSGLDCGGVLGTDMEDVIMGDAVSEWEADMMDVDYEACPWQDDAVDLALEEMLAEASRQAATTHRVEENAVGYDPRDEGLADYEDEEVVDQYIQPATGSKTAPHPEDGEGYDTIDNFYTYPLTEEQLEDLNDRDYCFYMKYGYLD